MHRVVPELIVENFRAGCYRGEFPAVGLFLDLSGFSSMTDALMQHGHHGAEVLAGLMHGVFDPLVESIFSYGGKIIGFAGDGIMALFPIEADPANTALRAVASAHVVQQRLAQNPTRQTVYGTFPISAKIGLAVGSVSWAILLSEDGEDASYYFRGTAVDQSAEAEHFASAGEILLSAGLRELLHEQILTTPHGAFHRFAGFRVEMPASTPPVFPPVDLEIARRFMPEEVIAYDVRGEFRQVVNLFMRFPDLPEEALRRLMGIVFTLRKKYGGLLSRLDFGDKGCNMLMLWGAPVAYENDIGRALNFLLDLKSRVEFPITAGVTYYVAHAGYLGSAVCEDYTCYGWGVSLASRFMMSAPPNEVWVDDRIARRVSKRFEIEFRGAHGFKGFAASQKVHVLRGYKPSLESVYQGELVGRETELTSLTDFIAPIWEGRFAGLCLISGDAGIGKGRLVHEFRFSELFERNKVLWAVCQSDQILRRSFNPVRTALLRYFGITPQQSPELRRQAFDAKLDELVASASDPGLALELDRIRSLIAALVDVYWPGSLFEQLDAEGRYNNTLLALTTLVKLESLRQPVILFLEDLQFTDGDTRDFLPRLKRTLIASEPSYPIAIIVSTRPQGATLDADLVDLRIDLHGLPEPAIARLVENLLGGVAAPGLVRLVAERSEGNPYFAEQIVRYLREENLIEMSAGGWAPVRRPQEILLPGDIRALLVARLDQLAREVRITVQTASVLGREFEVQALEYMLREMHEVQDVQRCVAEAERAAIWTPLNEMRYVFSHGLLRDAAYAMQTRARRRELHALAMDALENLYAMHLEAHWAELAHHAERADLPDKAQYYYTRAGRASADLFQNKEAIEYFTRALAHTPPDDLFMSFDLLSERVELFNRLGDRPSQARDLDSLAELARRLDDSRRLAKVEMLWAHYFISISDYPSVIRHAERVMELNWIVEDAQVALDTYRVWPLALLRQGKLDEAMRVAQEGRQLARLYGDPSREGYILNSMGLIAIEQQDPTVAHGYLEQALAIARETGDRRLESRTLGNLGNSAGYVQRDYAAARDYYEKASLLHHETADRSQEAVDLGNLGWLAGLQGDLRAARSYLEQALLAAREVGNLFLETNTLINLSATMSLEADPRASLDLALKALELSRQTGDRSSEAWSLLYMGYACLLLGDLPRAEECFRHSVAIRDELGQPGMKMESLAGLVQTLLEQGDGAGALEGTEQIMSYLDAGGMLEGTEEPLRVFYTCYLVLEKARDPRARSVLQKASQLLEAHLSKLRDEASRRMYVENVPWRLALREAWRKAAG